MRMYLQSKQSCQISSRSHLKDFFEERHPNKNTNKNKMSSDVVSVPDQKNSTGIGYVCVASRTSEKISSSAASFELDQRSDTSEASLPTNTWGLHGHVGCLSPTHSRRSHGCTDCPFVAYIPVTRPWQIFPRTFFSDFNRYWMQQPGRRPLNASLIRSQFWRTMPTWSGANVSAWRTTSTSRHLIQTTITFCLIKGSGCSTYSSVHCRRQSVSCCSHSSMEQSSIARHCCPLSLHLLLSSWITSSLTFLSLFLTLLSLVQCPRSDSLFWTLSLLDF